MLNLRMVLCPAGSVPVEFSTKPTTCEAPRPVASQKSLCAMPFVCSDEESSAKYA